MPDIMKHTHCLLLRNIYRSTEVVGVGVAASGREVSIRAYAQMQTPHMLEKVLSLRASEHWLPVIDALSIVRSDAELSEMVWGVGRPLAMESDEDGVFEQTNFAFPQVHA